MLLVQYIFSSKIHDDNAASHSGRARSFLSRHLHVSFHSFLVQTFFLFLSLPVKYALCSLRSVHIQHEVYLFVFPSYRRARREYSSRSEVGCQSFSSGSQCQSYYSQWCLRPIYTSEDCFSSRHWSAWRCQRLCCTGSSARSVPFFPLSVPLGVDVNYYKHAMLGAQIPA